MVNISMCPAYADERTISAGQPMLCIHSCVGEELEAERTEATIRVSLRLRGRRYRCWVLVHSVHGLGDCTMVT